VEEARAVQADLDERGLHAREHPCDLARIDVSDQAAARRALDVQLLGDTRLHHRDAGLLRRDVDQDVLGHGNGEDTAI
jgi:hypothetical protein